MTFDEYQAEADKTALYDRDEYAIQYPVTGLASEVGELCGHLKRVLRDDGGNVYATRKAAMLAEVGDCLWYLAAVCTDLGASLGQVALDNVEKLRGRLSRGTLRGEGDER